MITGKEEMIAAYLGGYINLINRIYKNHALS